jgi:glycosyltransferase involved in cell wall biosynthesis
MLIYSADISWLREEEKKRIGRLRVRKNTSHQGASASRNNGLDESAADWILFLDDDVIPDAKLIDAYAKAIEKHGHETDGFVGPTELPKYPITQFNTAVNLADITYFWDITLKMDRAPWVVTGICSYSLVYVHTSTANV